MIPLSRNETCSLSLGGSRACWDDIHSNKFHSKLKCAILLQFVSIAKVLDFLISTLHLVIALVPPETTVFVCICDFVPCA